MHIHWTMREWQLVEATIDDPSCNPSPRAIDAAQRAALPPHRWRPRTALYGRHNRAHYRGELTLARMRNIEARALADRQRLADAEAAQARLEAHQQALARELEDIKRRMAEMPKPVTRPHEEARQAARATRIDVVGLIGQQVTYVKRLLPPELQGRVHFILADDISRVKSPAPLAVLFTSFINHDAEDKYSASKILRVRNRSAGSALPAIQYLIETYTKENV